MVSIIIKAHMEVKRESFGHLAAEAIVSMEFATKLKQSLASVAEVDRDAWYHFSIVQSSTPEPARQGFSELCSKA